MAFHIGRCSWKCFTMRWALPTWVIRNQDLAQEIGKKRGKARVDVGEISGNNKVNVGEIDQKRCIIRASNLEPSG